MTNLEPSSEIFIVKTNLSTFGIAPKYQNKSIKRKKAASSTINDIQPLEIIEPMVVNSAIQPQIHHIPQPAFQMPPNFTMFYDSFLRFGIQK